VGVTRSKTHVLDDLAPKKTMYDVENYMPPDHPYAPHRYDNIKRLISRYKGDRALIMMTRDDFFAKMPFLGIVDGLIVIGLHVDDKRLRILEQQRVPVTVVHNRLEQPPVVANVLPASERALRNLIDQHLIRQHGYRRLALVTLSSSNPLKMGETDRPDWTRTTRIQAYEDALRANEIPVDEKLIFEVAD
jgi:hypothetical protein